MKNTRRLTEGAVLLAICAIILLITLYVPVLNIVSTLFMPLPFIYIAWKNDWKGIMVFFIASIIISWIVGTISALPISIFFGTIGITLGYLVQKNKSRLTILTAASFIFIFNVLVIYGIVVKLFDVNFIAEATEIAKNNLDTSYEKLIAAGQENEAKRLKEQLEEMMMLIKTLFPSVIVVVAFIYVFLLQLINFSILKRLGMNVNHWNPISELSLPKSILWYYLFTTILTLVLNPEEGSYLYTALLNLVYILQILLVFQGISLVFYVSHLKKWPKAIPILITVLTIMPLVLYIIRILGIIDLGFDLRKRLVKK